MPERYNFGLSNARSDSFGDVKPVHLNVCTESFFLFVTTAEKLINYLASHIMQNLYFGVCLLLNFPSLFNVSLTLVLLNFFLGI